MGYSATLNPEPRTFYKQVLPDNPKPEISDRQQHPVSNPNLYFHQVFGQDQRAVVCPATFLLDIDIFAIRIKMSENQLANPGPAGDFACFGRRQVAFYGLVVRHCGFRNQQVSAGNLLVERLP